MVIVIRAKVVRFVHHYIVIRAVIAQVLLQPSRRTVWCDDVVIGGTLPQSFFRVLLDRRSIRQHDRACRRLRTLYFYWIHYYPPGGAQPLGPKGEAQGGMILVLSLNVCVSVPRPEKYWSKIVLCLCLPVSVFVSRCLCLPVCLPARLPFCLSIYLSVCLTSLSLSLSLTRATVGIFVSDDPLSFSVLLPLSVSVFMTVCMPTCVSVCLSAPPPLSPLWLMIKWNQKDYCTSYDSNKG